MCYLVVSAAAAVAAAAFYLSGVYRMMPPMSKMQV